MRRAIAAVSVILFISLSVITDHVFGRQITDRIRLECTKAEKVDVDHFRSVVEFVNETKFDVYVQSAIGHGGSPYPLYLERRLGGDNWQIVAPCLDAMPSGAITVPPGRTIKVDQVYALELPSTCSLRRIDPSGEYRWSIEYFKNKGDLLSFERTKGSTGKARKVASKPFLITP